MEKQYDIVSLGEILIDFVPDGTDENGDEKYLCKAGGAPLNVLATCAKYGLKTAFIGKVGDDIFGRKLLKVLKDNNIDSSAVVTDEYRNTTLAFVKLNEDGDRDFSFYRRYGADAFLDKRETDYSLLEKTIIFHFGSLSFTGEPVRTASVTALENAKRNGCIITYDPNYRPLLWNAEFRAVKEMRDNLRYADIVKLSREELELITGSSDIKNGISEIKNSGVKIIIVTDGAGDVYYTAGVNINSLPAKKVKAVDTTGAGDIFFGSFITAFVKDGADINNVSDEKMKAYVSKAIEKAAQSVMKKGAVSSVPDSF